MFCLKLNSIVRREILNTVLFQSLLSFAYKKKILRRVFKRIELNIGRNNRETRSIDTRSVPRTRNHRLNKHFFIFAKAQRHVIIKRYNITKTVRATTLFEKGENNNRRQLKVKYMSDV